MTEYALRFLTCLLGCEWMQPFLKWPGGKRWFVANYFRIFPQEYNTYFEPFLGGGSVFFYLMPQQATISDINSDLINIYRVMANNPLRLKALMSAHQENHCKEYYYNVRSAVPDDPVVRAARFLYLNRTCFNGMYRVNQHGDFNVPIGTRKNFVDDIEIFEEYSRVLQNAHIRSQDFVKTIRGAGAGDLIFADPPYTIAHNQNSFIKYNERLFSWRDQTRLLNALVRARERGAIIVATNALYPQLEQMYFDNGFYTYTLNRFSSISGNANGRKRQEELLITSYPVELE